MSTNPGHDNIGSLAAAAFASTDQAEAALQALIDDGFTEDEIGVIGSTEEDHLMSEWLPQAEEASGEASGSHVAVGGLIGGLIGGVAAFAIPGVGWALGAGIIATAIAGGSFGGGIVGPLMDLEVEEDRAIYLNDRLEAGDIIVTVQTNRSSDAQDILEKFGGKTANT